MATYLETLERLGKLRDDGFLTKEEFDAEKAHLLHTRQTSNEIEGSPSKLRLGQYIILSSIIVVLLGGGISYFIFKKEENNFVPAKVNVVSSDASEAGGPLTQQDVSITFADTNKCEPGPSFSDLLEKIRDAAVADEGSDQRLIRLAGSPSAAEVQSSVRNFGPQQIRLGSLAVSQTWQGLHLSELRTVEWDGGDGFQLRFAGSPENLLRIVQSVGFPIKSLQKPATYDGTFEAIEKSPGGAILTCMKSNKAGQPATDVDVSVNQTGE